MLEKAVALDPDSPLPYRALTVVQINIHDTDAALKTLQAAKKRFPAEPAFAAQSAALLRQIGRPEEAEEEVALAVSLGRKNNPPHVVSTAAASGQPEPSPAALAPAQGDASENHAARPTVQGDPHGTSPGNQEASANKPNTQYQASLSDLHLCLARENAACATAALATIQDPAIERSPNTCN